MTGPMCRLFRRYSKREGEEFTLRQRGIMSARFKALIFDFDGVLADTEPTHMRMFQWVLAEERLFLNDDEYLYHYLGLTDRACFSAVYRANGRSISTEHLDALVARKSRHMLEAL